MTQYRKSNDVLGTVNRGDPCESGLCTLCRADCKGKCETWLSSHAGQKNPLSARLRHGHGGQLQHKPHRRVLQQPAHPRV